MTETYYNRLAPYYKYIHNNWEVSVKRQSEILDGICKDHFGDTVHHILDAACGIGTQTIGLAERGYQMTASDISVGELEQARLEAEKRQLAIHFQVADMRQLTATFSNQFDVVLAGDNAIPHLLTDEDILLAFQQFYEICTFGCMFSVRDYATLAHPRQGSQLHPRKTHEIDGGHLVIFDRWDFDGDFYDITTYIVQDMGEDTAETVVIRGGRYYCVTVSKLVDLLEQAGFKAIHVEKGRFFQPLLIGKK